MSLDQQIDAVAANLKGKTATETECLHVTRRCMAAGRPFDALLLLDMAVIRLPRSAALRTELVSVLQSLETSGSLDTLIDRLPPRGDPVRQWRSDLTQKFGAHHGPDGARPASAHFFQSVLLKNLCQLIPQEQPLWQVLLRICEHHGRRAAEEAFGVPVAAPTAHADRTVSLAIGPKTARFGITSNSIGFELLYFYAFEPGIIRWIAGFDAQDVLLDIGANVGKYALLAAVVQGCRTYAVEPFTPNVEALKQNIAHNGAGDRVSAHRWAISDRTGEGRLSYEKSTAGAAAQNFDEPSTETGKAEVIPGYRLDDLLESRQIEFPHHIKIDVDGTEHRIIGGMEKTLSDPRLKSIRLEIRLADPRNQTALARIRARGFDCAVDDDEKNWLCLRR